MDTSDRIIPFPNGKHAPGNPPWQRKPRNWNVRLLVAADRDSGAEAEGVIHLNLRHDNTWELSVHSRPDVPLLTLIGDERSSAPQMLREILFHIFRTA